MFIFILGDSFVYLFLIQIKKKFIMKLVDLTQTYTVRLFNHNAVPVIRDIAVAIVTKDTVVIQRSIV